MASQEKSECLEHCAFFSLCCNLCGEKEGHKPIIRQSTNDIGKRPIELIMHDILQGHDKTPQSEHLCNDCKERLISQGDIIMI